MEKILNMTQIKKRHMPQSSKEEACIHLLACKLSTCTSNFNDFYITMQGYISAQSPLL